MGQLQAGTGRSDITPAPGTPQGIWGAQLHQRGIGADMPLYATALALTDGETTALIIDVDVIGFNEEWAGRVLEAVVALTGLPREAVRVAASHTHSGPKTMRLEVVSEGLDMGEEYLQSLPRRIAGAGWQAMRNLRPVRIAAGEGSCAINVNRRVTVGGGRVVVGRNWDAPVDRTVRVVRVDDLEEQPVAVIVHYACHPTIMAWENEWFTPDFPGVVREVVEREMGGHCLFLQGAAGSVGPVRGFTGDRAVYRRLGRMLGLEAAKVALAIDTRRRVERFVGVMESGAPIALYEDVPAADEPVEFTVRSRTLQLPANEFPPHAELVAAVAQLREALAAARTSGEGVREATAALTRATMKEERARMVRGQAYVERQLQVVRLGDIALVSMQDEPFGEIGERIVAGSPFRHTLVSGYSNGTFGYMPTRAAFAEGGYEVDTALYGPDTEDIVVEAALALLRELGAGRVAAGQDAADE
jgi:hypothetical protein